MIIISVNLSNLMVKIDIMIVPTVMITEDSIIETIINPIIIDKIKEITTIVIILEDKVSRVIIITTIDKEVEQVYFKYYNIIL